MRCDGMESPKEERCMERDLGRKIPLKLWISTDLCMSERKLPKIKKKTMKKYSWTISTPYIGQGFIHVLKSRVK